MTKNYNKLDKTYQQLLTKQDIKDKLKEYKPVSNISSVSIGTHIRYFIKKDKEELFRLGGVLNKIDPQGRFITLSNGSTNWSVQLDNSKLFQKMTEEEIKNELKEEIKKELLNSEIDNLEIHSMKKEIKKLEKDVEMYKELDKNYKLILKKNEQLNEQLNSIKEKIEKNKIDKKNKNN
jgi:hypothetical protein